MSAPLASPSRRGYARQNIPEEVEKQILNSIKFGFQQIRYLRLRSHDGVDSGKGIGMLLERNKEKLFSNTNLMEYMFKQNAFRGENVKPDLRPSLDEDGIENPEGRTYAQLIRTAKAGYDEGYLDQLRKMRKESWVRYRFEVAIRSKAFRKDQDRPTQETKARLQIDASNNDNYTTLISKASGNQERINKLQEARRDDDTLRQGDKLALYRSILDTMERNNTSFAHTCRGCFGNETRKRDGYPPLCWDCMDLYCKEYLISMFPDWMLQCSDLNTNLLLQAREI
jgi:hypothetical protein